jgi:3-oxoacyl-[acyl-carrier protein] reductase
MKIDLSGRVALVTGGSRGIGRACALALAGAGADVMIAYRSAEAAAAAVKAEIETLGRRAEICQADVTQTEQVDALFALVSDRFGRLDILVNNAGVIADALIGVLEADDWDRVVDTNLKGTFLCTRAALPWMMPRRSGKIVNLGSVASLRTRRGQAAYAAAKGGVVAFTRASAAELAAKGIQVNAVLPGIIVTEMSSRIRRQAEAELLAATPAGRFGTPEEVANLVVFLCSDAAAYITGQAVAVDGGISVA